MYCFYYLNRGSFRSPWDSKPSCWIMNPEARKHPFRKRLKKRLFRGGLPATGVLQPGSGMATGSPTSGHLQLLVKIWSLPITRKKYLYSLCSSGSVGTLAHWFIYCWHFFKGGRMSQDIYIYSLYLVYYVAFYYFLNLSLSIIISFLYLYSRFYSASLILAFLVHYL